MEVEDGNVDEGPRAIVTVRSGKGLKGDSKGRSDLCCVCSVAGKPHSKFMTQTVSKNVNPQWDHQEQLPGYELGDDIEFVVLDHDRHGAEHEVARAKITSDRFTPDGFDGELQIGKGMLRITIDLYLPAPSTEVSSDPGASIGPDDRRPTPFHLRSMDTGQTHRLSCYTAVGRSKRQLDMRYDLVLDSPGICDVSRLHCVIKAWCGSDPDDWWVCVYDEKAGLVGRGLGGGHAGGGTSVDNESVDPIRGTLIEVGSVLRFGVREMWILERTTMYKRSQVGGPAAHTVRINAIEDPAVFRELLVPSGACHHALQHCTDWDSLVQVVLEWCGKPDEVPCVDMIEVFDECGKIAGRHVVTTLDEQEMYKVEDILKEVRMGCRLRLRLSSDVALLAPISGRSEAQRKTMEELHSTRGAELFGRYS